jgi:Mn-dependent DtxR family transcriptional regulator
MEIIVVIYVAGREWENASEASKEFTLFCNEDFIGCIFETIENQSQDVDTSTIPLFHKSYQQNKVKKKTAQWKEQM